MIKIILFVLLAMPSLCFGKDRYELESLIGPTLTTSSATVTISAAGSGKVNCLDYIVSNSTLAYVVRVLNGDTTSYTITHAANEEFNQMFIQPHCGSANTQMRIKLTPTSGRSTELIYQGFVGR